MNLLMKVKSDEDFMRRAILLAHKAEEQGEVPVGALVVSEGQVIGEGWNQMISTSDPSAHAEVLALRSAAKQKQNYRLPACELYVTIEPCTMCLGTMIHSRIARVVYGAREPRAGVLESNVQLGSADFYNHNLNWNGGVLEEECSELIKNFFRQRRK